MTQHDSVRARLHAIEALLRQHQLWQETAPQPEAFASTQPFCLDTLAPFMDSRNRHGRITSQFSQLLGHI